METILRAAAVFFFLFILMRIAGKRTLAEVTTFDFIILLILSETTQEALIGDDFSLTTAALSIVTLVFLDIALSLLQIRFKGFNKTLNGTPTVILKDGEPLKEIMKKLRLDEAEILEAARAKQGLEKLDQIKYAVLETNGSITIIPN
jgi:uncharacterized membrane protein YcaP (DUF421 family)